MLVKKCKLCKKQFEQSHGNQKFCSERCSEAFYSNYRESWKKDNPQIEEGYTKSGARAYNNIRQRCENPRNPQYTSYGGRGIRLVISREEFVKIYFSTDTCELCGKQLDDERRNSADGRTLDRIDQARSYEQGNLRLLCRACNTSLAYKRRKNRL